MTDAANEAPKERRKRQIRNRLVYNDWGLYSLVQVLAHKCLRFGKELHIIDERDSHRCKRTQDMPLWKRTYRCTDENSAANLYQRFAAGPRHTLGFECGVLHKRAVIRWVNPSRGAADYANESCTR